MGILDLLGIEGDGDYTDEVCTLDKVRRSRDSIMAVLREIAPVSASGITKIGKDFGIMVRFESEPNPHTGVPSVIEGVPIEWSIGGDAQSLSEMVYEFVKEEVYFDFNPPPQPAKPTPPSKPKRKGVQYSFSCTFNVGGSEYDVTLLPESPHFDKGYRLIKKNSKKESVYDVVQSDGELICECADFKYRREGADSQGCKHIRALVDFGVFARQLPLKEENLQVFD